MKTHDTPEKSYDLERLIFFSDGVFAIVITLLVIELHPPPHWDRTLHGLWTMQWRSLMAYAVTFFVVGLYWNAHRRLFARVVRFHPGLVIANLVLLALVVLLPFVEELLFETTPRGEPLAIYFGLIGAIGLAQALIWAFAALVAKVVDDRMSQRDRWMTLVLMLFAPVIVVAAAVAAWANVSSSLWVVMVPILIVANLARRRMLAGGARL
jgi:uncharacterized membrane protein